MLPPRAPAGPVPHLQAATPNHPCSDNLAVARGEEGDCTCECLQGVCGGAAAGCSARPPSTPAAAGDVPAYARGDLGDGRPQHSGAQSRPVGWPPTSAPTCYYLPARVWCFPACSDLQLCGSCGNGATPLLVISGDALPSATAFRYRPPRGRL